MTDTTPTPAPAGVPLWDDEYLDGEKHRHIDMLHSGARTYMDWDCITLLLAKEMRDFYEAELAKLRTQLAEQWTPVPDGLFPKEHGHLVRIMDNGKCIWTKDILLGYENRVYLPDDMRLCSKPKESTE